VPPNVGHASHVSRSPSPGPRHQLAPRPVRLNDSASPAGPARASGGRCGGPGTSARGDEQTGTTASRGGRDQGQVRRPRRGDRTVARRRGRAQPRAGAPHGVRSPHRRFGAVPNSAGRRGPRARTRGGATWPTAAVPATVGPRSFRAGRTSGHFGDLELRLTAARLCRHRRARQARLWPPELAVCPAARTAPGLGTSELRRVPCHGRTLRKSSVQRRSNPVRAIGILG
jgi:hypothetical protein